MAVSKGKISGVAEVVKIIAQKRPGPITYEARVSRLRGQHGYMLLPNIKKRIDAADILVMDIGSVNKSESFNANVLVELGLAISSGHSDRGRIFILKPLDIDAPSDLKGFVFTEYSIGKEGQIKLVDDAGFRASLRSAFYDLAMSREMIGAPKNPEVTSD